MSEADFIARLRSIATDPAARGLADDVAVLGDLVLTHDMIVEGVHFLPDDTPQDIAWKLVAVNLSDLAAKGAAPLGVLLGKGFGWAFIINILLTLLGYIPGLIHAFWVQTRD